MNSSTDKFVLKASGSAWEEAAGHNGDGRRSSASQKQIYWLAIILSCHETNRSSCASGLKLTPASTRKQKDTSTKPTLTFYGIRNWLFETK